MLKHILPILLLFVQSCVVFAGDNTKFVLHLNDTFKLGHLNNSVKNIRSEMGDKVKIKIIINGKAVQLMLKSNKTSTEIVNNILQRNADIGLCHNALRNNHVDKNKLIQGVNVLSQDGNVTIYQLQKKGYIYVKM